MAKQRESVKKFQEIPEEQRREKSNSRLVAGDVEVYKRLAEFLKPEQVKRFDQINVQLNPLHAFLIPRLQDELKLTDDQKSKIPTIQEQGVKAFRAAVQAAIGDQQDYQEAMQKIIADTNRQRLEKLMALLTDDQKKAWKDMLGEPFKFRVEARRPNEN